MLLALTGLKVLLIAAHMECFLHVWSLDIHSRHLQWNGSGGLTLHVCSDTHCVEQMTMNSSCV